MNFRYSIALALIALVGCAGKEEPSGAELAVEKGCVACHGYNGRSIAPTFPNLDGQWETYLRLQLMAYRAGTRDNAIMTDQAAALTDAEIRALARHFSGG
ncbi:MAG: cytochrome c [Gammaproteobacteria bacterium]|nr:cytochrome c [Gammaproteobacteria bacterium]